MATPAFEPGRFAPYLHSPTLHKTYCVLKSSPRSTDPSTHLSRLLEVSIRRSSALSTESLCLVAGQSVWSLATIVHVLSHDGSLFSAACIAVVCSLAHFRLPDTSVKGGELTVYTLKEREPVPLALLHWPLCVSFAVFEGGGRLVVDATLREEQCSEGEIVVTANKSGEICAISKQGGVPTDALVILGCVDTAVRKVAGLDSLIKAALEKENNRRDVGGLMKELRAENER